MTDPENPKARPDRHPQFAAVRDAMAGVLIEKGLGSVPDDALVWKLAYKAVELLAVNESGVSDTPEPSADEFEIYTAADGDPVIRYNPEREQVVEHLADRLRATEYAKRVGWAPATPEPSERQERIGAARQWLRDAAEPTPARAVYAVLVGRAQHIIGTLLAELEQDERGVVTGHEIVIEEAERRFTAACVCGWRSHQEWETQIGAERDGEFHVEHPVLTGEHAAVEEAEQ